MKRLALLLLIPALLFLFWILARTDLPESLQNANSTGTHSISEESAHSSPESEELTEDVTAPLTRMAAQGQHLIHTFDESNTPLTDVDYQWSSGDEYKAEFQKDGQLQLDSGARHVVASYAKGLWSIPIALDQHEEARTDWQLKALYQEAQLTVRAFRSDGGPLNNLRLVYANPIYKDSTLEPLTSDDVIRHIPHLWKAKLGGDYPKTDSNELILPQLPPGSWSFTVQSDSSVPETFTLDLAPGEFKTHELRLQPAGWITARLQHPDGSPADDAWAVKVEGREELDDVFAWIVAPKVKPKRAIDANEEGVVRVGPLRPGAWRLSASCPEMVPLISDAFDVSNGATVDAGTMTFELGRTVSLTVLSPQGQPAPQAKVSWVGEAADSLMAAIGSWREAGHTDDEGKLLLSGLPTEVISFRAEHANLGSRSTLKHTFEANDEPIEKPVELTLSLGESYSVTGIVQDSNGTRIPEAKVRLSPADGTIDFSVFSAKGSNKSLMTQSDESGSWVIPNAPPGDWRIVAESENHSAWIGEAFLLDTQTTSHHEICTLGAGAHLEIIIPDAVGAEENVYLTLNRLEGDGAESGSADEQGRAVFPHLTPGEWRIQAIFLKDVAPGESRTSDLKMLYDTVTLSEGEWREIELGSGGAKATLEGVVTRGGAPEPKRTVLLIAGSNLKSGITDESGFYRIEDIEPGRYMTFIGEVGGSAGSSGHSEQVVIDAGLATRNFELPDSDLLIRVISHQGKPLAGMPVTLRGEDAPITKGGGTRMTNAKGEATFLFLRPGPWVATIGKASLPILGDDDVNGSKVIRFDVPESGSPEDIEVQLDAAATFRARVLDGNGQALQGAMLFYLDADGQPLSNLSKTPTNSKGVAQLKGLPSGKGFIHVRHLEHGVAQVPVNLLGGELTKQEIQLEPGTMLHIQVIDAEGEPLAGVFPSVLDERNAPISMLFNLAEAQQFNLGLAEAKPAVIGPLQEGTYKVVLARVGAATQTHTIQVQGGGGEMHLDLPYVH